MFSKVLTSSLKAKFIKIKTPANIKRAKKPIKKSTAKTLKKKKIKKATINIAESKTPKK